MIILIIVKTIRAESFKLASVAAFLFAANTCHDLSYQSAQICLLSTLSLSRSVSRFVSSRHLVSLAAFPARRMAPVNATVETQ